LSWLFVTIGAITMTIPFLWMLRTSLMEGGQADLYPPVLIPNPFLWSNYADVFAQVPMALFTLNSIKVTGLSTLGILFSSSLCGYGFSRLRFRGRDTIFLLVLLTTMIPRAVTLIPLFILYTRIHWIDTHNPLIIPAYFGGAFSIFLMRQYFLTLPQELFDAATVDGASPLRQYWQIAIPLAGPALATVALFHAVSSWGDLMGPLIFLNRQQMMTLPVGITIFKGMYTYDMPRLMAASAMVAAPMIFLFIFTQKYFVRGIALTGIKG
jgi:multiple sugar transport system permease protein